MSGILLQIGALMSVFTERHRVTPTADTWTWTVYRVSTLSTSGCPPGQCKRGTSCHFILRGAENRQHRLILFLLTGAAHGSKEHWSIPLQMYA